MFPISPVAADFPYCSSESGVYLYVALCSLLFLDNLSLLLLKLRWLHNHGRSSDVPQTASLRSATCSGKEREELTHCIMDQQDINTNMVYRSVMSSRRDRRMDLLLLCSIKNVFRGIISALCQSRQCGRVHITSAARTKFSNFMQIRSDDQWEWRR